MPGKISTCMANLIALLSADAFFADPVAAKVVPIVSRLEADIDNKVDEAVSEGGQGIVLIVTLRRVRLIESGEPLMTGQLVFGLAATSNSAVNETGKNSYDVCERAMQLVNYKQNGVSASEGPGALFLVDADAIRPVPPPPKRPFINMQVLTVTTEIEF